jgi:hypothetical protein
MSMNEPRQWSAWLRNITSWPARFRTDDLVTAVGGAEWAEGAAVMVCVTELWHRVSWRTLLRRHLPYGSADFCKNRVHSSTSGLDRRETLAEKFLIKWSFARPRMRCEDNIKMCRRKIGCEDWWWMELTQVRGLWQILLLAMLNLWVPRPESITIMSKHSR